MANQNSRGIQASSEDWPDWLREANTTHEIKQRLWAEYQQVAQSGLSEERKRILLEDFPRMVQPLHPDLPEEEWPLWLKNAPFSHEKKLRILAGYAKGAKRRAGDQTPEEFAEFLNRPDPEDD